MNKGLSQKVIFQALPRLLSKTRRYIIYINIALLFVGGIWLFIFVKEYFLDVAQDFAFMEQNASALYHVSLNTKLYAEISAKHDKKLHTSNELPKDIVSPF